MAKFDKETSKVLEVVKKEGITLSDLLVFYCTAFQLEIKFVNEPRELIREVKQLIKIPEKKRKSF